jgi:hypothetical protein
MKIPISRGFAQEYIARSVNCDRFSESDTMYMFPRIPFVWALGAPAVLALAGIPAAAHAQDDSDTTASAPDQDSPAADTDDSSYSDDSSANTNEDYGTDDSAADTDDQSATDDSSGNYNDDSATDDSSADENDDSGAPDNSDDDDSGK